MAVAGFPRSLSCCAGSTCRSSARCTEAVADRLAGKHLLVIDYFSEVILTGFVARGDVEGGRLSGAGHAAVPGARVLGY